MKLVQSGLGLPSISRSWRSTDLGIQMSKILFTCLLSLLLGTAMAGDGISKARLIGKWSGTATNSSGDVATTTFNFRQDGTFSGDSEMNHKPFMSYSGTWALTGHKLVWTYTKSSVPLPESARVDTDEVLSVDKRHLILVSKLSGERRDYTLSLIHI